VRKVFVQRWCVGEWKADVVRYNDVIRKGFSIVFRLEFLKDREILYHGARPAM
jgi:hypothetical protein